VGARFLSQTVVRSTGRRASIVVVPPAADGGDIKTALELPDLRGLVVLNGGTDDLSPAVRERLSRMLRDGLARVVIEEGLTAVTGGTDAGIFQLFGNALGERAKGPCIGVAPAGLVEAEVQQTTAGSDAPRVPLEPHHTHFVLVEADQWGGETDVMLSLVKALAADAPSLTVLASGGDVAKREILAHVRSGREIVVIAGSGRLADEIVEAVVRPGAARDPEVTEIASGRVTVVDAEAPPSVLAALVRNRLAPSKARSLRNLPLLRPLPRIRWRARRSEPFVPSGKVADCPALEPDIHLLDRQLMPTFRKLDEESLRAQNTFRLGQLALILGGTAATALGAVQAALGGGIVALAVPEALLAGLLAGTVVYIRGRNAQGLYATNRLRAERLRSEYFLFLARAGRYAGQDEDARVDLLGRQVREIESLEDRP
jgi:hypothetical protein